MKVLNLLLNLVLVFKNRLSILEMVGLKHTFLIQVDGISVLISHLKI